ncbi:MAG: hypothetical protein Q7S73_02500 [bacterium]|nr:hypothetical protein [bacterium]
MSFKNSLILFSAFMAVGISSYIGVRNGFYPVAAVNFDFVLARDAQKNYSAAYKYFQNALLVYGSDPAKLETKESQFELRRSTLEKLILDRLVYDELKRRMGKREFQPIAETKIEQFLKSNANTEEAAKKIYGLNLSDFKDRVLLPQAYQEILEGRMFLNKENFNEWINKEKSSASIIILLSDFEWKEGALGAKK